jgi:hypothetical protein
MSILIPSDQLTLTDKKQRRADVVMAGQKAIIDKAICSDPNQVDYRMAQNIFDFGTTGREQWLTATLVAINAQYSVFTTLVAPLVGLAPQLANTKVAVFWGVAVNTTPNPVSLLSLRQGPNLASHVTTFATYNLEDLESELTMEGYFSIPIVYYPLDWINIVVTSKIATGAQAAVVLYCTIFERRGGVTS